MCVKSNDKTLRERDKLKKRKMKMRSDKRKNAKKSDLKLGDTVLVKQPKRDKLTTPFNHKPYEITNKKGSMITAERFDHQIARDSSHFKHVKTEPEKSPDPVIVEEEEDYDSTALKDSMPELRRSSRDRRPPSYLKDYVCD